jgi:hypothetical protein
MDKRIPLIGGAALVAVILAVFIIGSPDTGGEVVERAIRVDAGTEAQQVEDEVVRGSAGSRTAGTGAPTLIGSGSSSGAVPVTSATLGKPPKRSLALERRTNPESNWAAHSMAPWTEVRRQLASQGAPSELVDEVQAMLNDVRDLRLDGEAVDFDTLSTRQDALQETVRSSGYMNTVIGQMFDRLGENQSRYANGEFDPQPSTKTIP